MKNIPTDFQTVIDHFKSNRWSFQIDSQRPLFYAGFKGDNGIFRCLVAGDQSDDSIHPVGLWGVAPSEAASELKGKETVAVQERQITGRIRFN